MLSSQILKPVHYLKGSDIQRVVRQVFHSSKFQHCYPRSMASNSELERVKARSEQAEKILASLKDQIEAIQKAAVKNAGLGEEEKLIQENEALKQEILSIKRSLIVAELGNGVRQVQMPTKGALSCMSQTLVNGTASAPGKEEKTPASAKKVQQDVSPEAGGKKAKNEKKEKPATGEGKASAKKTAGEPTDAPVDISRLDMRVGKIVAVERHPDADSLYVEQVDLGEGHNRTIVSGLVKHVPINAMKERIAVFMCNLKPAKMRGILSEGMIMCAVGAEKTEILVPPTDSVIGDKVVVEQYPGTPDVQLNPKKKIWESLKPDVRTNKDRIATYKGSPLIIPGKGNVEAPTLAEAQIS